MVVDRRSAPGAERQAGQALERFGPGATLVVVVVQPAFFVQKSRVPWPSVIFTTMSSVECAIHADTAAPHANYDVTPDGRGFVFVRRNDKGVYARDEMEVN